MPGWTHRQQLRSNALFVCPEAFGRDGRPSVSTKSSVFTKSPDSFPPGTMSRFDNFHWFTNPAYEIRLCGMIDNIFAKA
jgi:hypothetical protein